MASTKMTRAVSKAIIDNIDNLLGRVVQHYRSPLSEDEAVIFWNSFFPDNVLAAMETIDEFGFTTTRFTRPDNNMCFAFAGRDYTWYFRGEDLLLSPRPKMLRHGRYEVHLDDIYERLPTGMKDAWEKWIVERSAIEVSYQTAFDTLHEVVNMCSTVGQLKRMIPELVTLLAGPQRAMLQAQTRASSVPPQWTTYDRSKVDDAVRILMSCHLMHELEFGWLDRQRHEPSVRYES